MEEGTPSTTAIASAMLRAAHLMWDKPPKIFADTLALRLAGCNSEADLRARFDRLDAELEKSAGPNFTKILRREATATVATRSRYVEDEFEVAAKRGVAQSVILGAGLDSFAYRRGDLAEVRVFEVDYPSTQLWKRTRVKEMGIELPPNLTFVPVDFEKQSFIDGLRANGYDSKAAGFFSWLGVTMYLTREAIFGTLRTVAALAPGTVLIFEYMVPKEMVDEETQKFLAVMMAGGVARGEPLQSFFEPRELEKQLRTIGFAEVSDFGPDDARARYFNGRSDELRPSALNHYMRACVGR